MNAASAHPDFWDQRYAAGRTPWDAGRVPPALARHLAAHPGRGERALIPGCGSGYEVAAFAAAGYEVTAIDFSPVAVARARAQVGAGLAGRIVEGDFFTTTFAAPFDVIYERTFFCALPPHLWRQVATRLTALVNPGGRLVGFFVFGAKEDGPPFGFAPIEPVELFYRDFQPVADQPIPVEESLPLFAGRERWQEWRRRP